MVPDATPVKLDFRQAAGANIPRHDVGANFGQDRNLFAGEQFRRFRQVSRRSRSYMAPVVVLVRKCAFIVFMQSE
jgi:hypothetical protein